MTPMGMKKGKGKEKNTWEFYEESKYAESGHIRI